MESIPVPLKIGAILAAALLMTCLCFLVMYTLISTDLAHAPTEYPALALPIIAEPSQDSPHEPRRKRPNRVMPAEIPPQPKGTPLRMAEPVVVRAQLPSRGSLAEEIGAEDLDLKLSPPLQDLVPLYMVQPVYPFKAVMKEIEGFVIVSFTVRENGSVINPVVISSEPGDIFDQAAVAAASRFRFRPRRVGVDHVAVPNLELKFIFELDGAVAAVSQIE